MRKYLMYPLDRFKEAVHSIIGNGEITDPVICAKLVDRLKDEPGGINMLVNYVRTGSPIGSVAQMMEAQQSPSLSGVSETILYDFQRDAMDRMGAQQTTLICASRQMGTTRMLCTYALHAAIESHYSRVHIMADRHTIGISHLEEIENMLIETNAYLEQHGIPQVDPKSYRTGELKLENGSIISASGSDTNRLRGKSLSVLIMDNVGRNLQQAYRDLYPCVFGARGKVLIAETGGRQDSFFYEMWKNHPAELIHLPWHLHPNRDDAWLKNARQFMAPSAFAREFGAEFIE